MDTLVELESVRRRHPHGPSAGSVEEHAALDRFAAFFAGFSPDRVERLLDETYAPDVYFDDTLKTVRGCEALGHYLRDSAQAVEDCRVEVQGATRDAHGEYLVRWKMMLRFRKLRRGVDTWSIGISHLRFDAQGRIAYQQDYWNAADGLFQHVPLLGWMIRALKRRL